MIDSSSMALKNPDTSGLALNLEDIQPALVKAGLLIQDPVGSISGPTLLTTQVARLPDDGCGSLLCYRGVSYDGHLQLKEAASQRAKLWIIENESALEGLDAATIPPYIVVHDSREAWSHLASLSYCHPEKNLRIMAITGTNGKTSTAWHVRSLLNHLNIPCLFIGTIGAYYDQELVPLTHTTPDPPVLWSLFSGAVRRGLTYVVMEVSSQGYCHGRVAPLTFCGSVFTSFSRDHLDFHPDMAAYLRAKIAILQHTEAHGPILVHQSIKAAYPEVFEDLAAVTVYGPENNQIEVNAHGVFLTIDAAHRGQLPLLPGYAVSNFYAAWMLVKQVTGQAVPSACWNHMSSVPGRLEEIGQSPRVFVDYAHTPDALNQTLATIKPSTKGQIWVVFGCGGDRDRGKRAEMGQVAACGADRLIITSDNPRTEDPLGIIEDIRKGIPSSKPCKIIPDRRQAITYAVTEADGNDAILVAGKGHEDYQLIGQSKLVFSDQNEVRTALAKRNQTNESAP